MFSFLAYRISSNKRRGAYLIFVILGAALIGGRRLLEGGAYFEISDLRFLKFFGILRILSVDWVISLEKEFFL